MMLLKEESLPDLDMDMKEDWYWKLLTDKSLTNSNSAFSNDCDIGNCFLWNDNSVDSPFRGNLKEAIFNAVAAAFVEIVCCYWSVGSNNKNDNPCKVTNPNLADTIVTK